jgi:hypothetical protein
MAISANLSPQAFAALGFLGFYLGFPRLLALQKLPKVQKLPKFSRLPLLFQSC